MTLVADRSAVAAGPRTAGHELVPLSFWLLIAGLTFNLFSGHADQLGLPINLDRLLLPAAMVLVLLESRPVRVPRWSVLAVFALFAMVATWSALGHDVHQDPVAAFALLDRVYLPLALCCAAPSLLASPRRRQLFLWFLTGVGLYLSVTTVAQFVGAQGLIWPPYARVEVTSSIRAGGPFASSEANGLALVMCGFAAAALAGTLRGPAQSLPMLTVPACLGSSVLCMTRSVWLAALLASVVFGLLNRKVWRGAGLLLVTLLLMALMAHLLAPDLIDDLMRRGGQASSVYDRWATNDAALRIMAEQPVTGVGWREFVHVGWEWVRQGDTTPLAHTHIEVHNVFLARGAELGIPGAVLFVACLWLGPVRGLLTGRVGELASWRAFAAATAAAWFASAMLSPNPYPFPNFLLWLVGGVLMSTQPIEPVQAESPPAEAMTAPRSSPQS